MDMSGKLKNAVGSYNIIVFVNGLWFKINGVMVEIHNVVFQEKW